MAQDYVVLKDSSEYGRIVINKSVFQSISEISVRDIDNISLKDTKFNKPVNVWVEKNKLHISADIRVKYGANVNATCGLVQNRIYENIVFMTGFKPSEVSVNVIGFEF